MVLSRQRIGQNVARRPRAADLFFVSYMIDDLGVPFETYVRVMQCEYVFVGIENGTSDIR